MGCYSNSAPPKRPSAILAFLKIELLHFHFCGLPSHNANQISSAGQLSPSQFPVFTIYAQKTCLPSASKCDAAWSFERVMNYELAAETRKRGAVETRQQCSELCLAEEDFDCR